MSIRDWIQSFRPTAVRDHECLRNKHAHERLGLTALNRVSDIIAPASAKSFVVSVVNHCVLRIHNPSTNGLSKVTIALRFHSNDLQFYRESGNNDRLRYR